MHNGVLCSAHTVVILRCRLHDVLRMSKYRLRECLQLEGDSPFCVSYMFKV